MADKDKTMPALRLCATGCNNDGCVYDEITSGTKYRCVDFLTRDAMAIIQDQEAEIQRLKNYINEFIHN